MSIKLIGFLKIGTSDIISYISSKDKCLESLGKKFTLHFEQPKQTNASKVSLEEIHDSLRKFVQEKWNIFSNCTHVLLENQPAFKNPHMKSVQVLLFATLREKFLSNEQMPAYHLVHAKKKVSDAKKGDEGYAERKSKSEDRLKKLFDEGVVKNDKIYEDVLFYLDDLYIQRISDRIIFLQNDENFFTIN